VLRETQEQPRDASGASATTVLELSPDADDQAVLRAALATGPVREFRRRRASLAELFRHVVSEGRSVSAARRPGEAA
jgi:ABC-2 type transport system ATP-binding protein